MNGSGSDDAAATRIWTEAHQAAFARATGDVNPMHMDARMARRTLAGERAVHGVHAALWPSMPAPTPIPSTGSRHCRCGSSGSCWSGIAPC